MWLGHTEKDHVDFPVVQTRVYTAIAVGTGSIPRRGKKIMRLQRETAIYKPREASEEINLVNTLILTFQPLEVWENKFLLCKSPSL